MDFERHHIVKIFIYNLSFFYRSGIVRWKLLEVKTHVLNKTNGTLETFR